MKNRIDELLTKLKDEHGVSVPEFAKRCELPKTTIYNARKRDDMSGITIDVFLKIAHGLGMSAEELYYGESYDLPTQPSISTEERRVLDGYRIADRGTRRTIMHAVDDAFADMEELAKKEARGA